MQTLTENGPTRKQQGLVISYFGASVAVEGDDGQVSQCHLKRNQELPVVGDKVIFEAGVIECILPRRSLLSKGLQHGKVKPIAANIDTIVIVMAPAPIFSHSLVDRYVAAAAMVKIEPMLVINKSDLLTSEQLLVANQSLDIYKKIGYQALLTSTLTEDGMFTLKQALKSKTAVLVGPSGVGKSSIIMAMGNEEEIRVGEVSSKGAGKHTTTASRLYHLKEGGYLIDSPGVRDFNLWPIPKKDVLDCFKEFNQYLTGCKFRDCSHLVEPACAIRAAVELGDIHPLRFESYEALMKASKHD